MTKLPKVDGPLNDIYRRSKLVIVPLFEGTGMSIKSIESLAMGCPTVTSPVGHVVCPSIRTLWSRSTSPQIRRDGQGDQRPAFVSLSAAGPSRRGQVVV